VLIISGQGPRDVKMVLIIVTYIIQGLAKNNIAQDCNSSL